ncbi:MAG: glutamine-hydrolyzing carbamoyl-phosphate synthase small subunit [Gammaproteobacteria bacterium]|nr:glutamine-hydrolyzing carbamoyl-phosphate synthase small subunit [Gammaproteobacteria bacterium]MDD9824560.1 glutamine-hydrolyzing carbamoyl-phosphate synthase small subunit [Gammaproteobacteria bacterium]
MTTQAILALEDGSVFPGRGIGASGRAEGEVVFNTAATGYQEIITDPSYHGQIVTFTQPHIGNVGTNREDEESARVHVRGLVVRALTAQPSNWRSRESLPDYLRRHGVVGIAEVDTRCLTRLLRERGAMRGCIVTGAGADVRQAVAAARQATALEGSDLVGEVSAAGRREREPEGEAAAGAPPGGWRVIAYDYGIKSNILHRLAAAGCRVTVVPAATPAREVVAQAPQGVFLSNGPGDPAACKDAIETVRELLAARVPLFGICLGCQLLALAAGARTVKMKFGHHGANHPVQELATGRVLITSQNHGFAVDEATLPSTLSPTHRSLFDGSLQGVRHTEAPAFGFQGHPEASPGPHDARPLFQRFTALMQEGAQ